MKKYFAFTGDKLHKNDGLKKSDQTKIIERIAICTKRYLQFMRNAGILNDTTTNLRIGYINQYLSEYKSDNTDINLRKIVRYIQAAVFGKLKESNDGQLTDIDKKFADYLQNQSKIYNKIFRKDINKCDEKYCRTIPKKIKIHFFVIRCNYSKHKNY